MGWTKFLRRGHWDDERARELESYLEIETDANLARGIAPREARAAAERKLGNATRIREEIYEMNTVRVVESAWQDLRYALRHIRLNPTFSLVAVLTIMLGTGANAAIFQLVNALRLRPLPVERPGELVSVDVDTQGRGHVGWGMNRRAIITEPLWRGLSAQQEGFASLFAYGVAAWNLETDGNYREAQGLYVSGGFFDGLGVRPALGRLLTAADDTTACPTPGAVLAHGFWAARYGSDRTVVGRTITLDGRAFPILGVAPRGFFGVEVGRTFDVAVPLCAEPLMRGEMAGTGHRERWFLDAMGRLKADWTVQRAGAQLAAISPGIFGSTIPAHYNVETAKRYAAFRFLARPAPTGVSGLRTEYAVHLWLLLGATALVLLVACANLANLMLARATVREREIAVRLAIGASRGRLVRQLISESLVIAGLGALGALLLARWLSEALVAFLSSENDMIFLDLAPDWRLVAFITLATAAACVVFGVMPAVAATGKHPARAMQAGGRSNTDSRERATMRRALVVVQVALSMVLAVGALLFGQTLQKLVNVDPGFRADGVISLDIDLRRTAIAPAARLQAFEEILSRVRAVPGVRAAARSMITPMSGSEWNGPVHIDGVERPGSVHLNQVTGDYFRLMEIRLLAGRSFDGRDRLGSPDVAVVNQAFARRHFQNASPVGRVFEMDEGPGRPRKVFNIVGLVTDTKYLELREDWKPIAYFAASQETHALPTVQMAVRSEMPGAGLTPLLTRAVVAGAPGATVAYSTIARNISLSLATERLMATLSGFFGVLALVIATIGLYGVMSYTVTRRRAEIGIRIVLGAAPRNVVRMVLGESAVLLALGVAAGLLTAVVASRWASSLLFGLSAWDPFSFGIAASILTIVCLLAAWLPARQAARLEPTATLRD